MKQISPKNKQNVRVQLKRCAGLCIALILGTAVATSAGTSPPQANLALGHPAVSSSLENEDHDASHANDGKQDTCWTADDEPEGVPDWWRVDLGEPLNLSAIEITWPFDRMNYRCKVEGSADLKHWRMLSDQSKSMSRSQVQRITLDHSSAVRYVRITITGFDSGCCAGISEVRVFSSSQ